MTEALDMWANEGGALPVLPPTKAEEDSNSMKMWKALHNAFDFLNEELFDNKLDRNMIILNCSRRTRVLGFYRYKEFGWVPSEEDGGEPKAEISLNPDFMGGEKIEKIYSTLAHEMAHFWQDCFGTPGKRGYHNKEWAEEMDRIGLPPFNVSDLSKKTGMRCSHSIDPEGLFALVMGRMPEEFKLPFMGLRPPVGKAKTGYQKWSCPNCNQVSRAKDTSQLACSPCSMAAFTKYESGETDIFEMVRLVCVGF